MFVRTWTVVGEVIYTHEKQKTKIFTYPTPKHVSNFLSDYTIQNINYNPKVPFFVDSPI